MKYLIVSFSTVLLICAGFILTSCGGNDDDNTPPTPLLEVASGDRSQSFDMDAGSRSVAVNANVQFTASVDQAATEWCSAAVNATAKTVTITVTANTGASRTATVTLSAKDVPDVVINVSQEEYVERPYLTVRVDLRTQEFKGRGGENTVPVSSNVDYTFSVPAADEDWCFVVPTEGGIMIITEENDKDAERNTIVTLSGTGVTPVQITVVQLPVVFSLLTMFDDCETNTGWDTWNGGKNLPVTLDGDNKTQGDFSISVDALPPGDYLWWMKSYEPVNRGLALETDYFAFDWFISDVSKLKLHDSFVPGNSGIYVSSYAGVTPDNARWGFHAAWNIADLDLHDGWNHLELSFASSSIRNEFDLDAITCFSLATARNDEGLTFKFDNMRFIRKE